MQMIGLDLGRSIHMPVGFSAVSIPLWRPGGWEFAGSRSYQAFRTRLHHQAPWGMSGIIQHNCIAGRSLTCRRAGDEILASRTIPAGRTGSGYSEISPQFLDLPGRFLVTLFGERGFTFVNQARLGRLCSFLLYLTFW
jgi:hypothetical protein